MKKFFRFTLFILLIVFIVTPVMAREEHDWDKDHYPYGEINTYTTDYLLYMIHNEVESRELHKALDLLDELRSVIVIADLDAPDPTNFKRRYVDQYIEEREEITGLFNHLKNTFEEGDKGDYQNKLQIIYKDPRGVNYSFYIKNDVEFFDKNGKTYIIIGEDDWL